MELYQKGVLSKVTGALLDDRKRIGWRHIFLVFTPSEGAEHFLSVCI